MPEQYTQVRNLFDTPLTLNPSLRASATGTAPFTEKLFYTRYSDRRLEFDGTFFVVNGGLIAPGNDLIILTDNDLFPAFTAQTTSFIITRLAPPLEFGGSQYDPLTKTIKFRATATMLTLTDSIRYYIRGTIVPHEIENLGVNQFSG